MTKYKQFKDLTREEKLGIFEAELDGELERQSVSGEWYTPCTYHKDLITFKQTATYRRKSYQLDIPWDYLDEKYQWVAMDKDGAVYAYKSEPPRSDYSWDRASNDCKLITLIKNKPDLYKWKETLTKRPEGV